MHCAANRFPDKVDKDPEGTRKLNVEATRDLARLCAKRDIFLVYISTDCTHSLCPRPQPVIRYQDMSQGLERSCVVVSRIQRQDAEQTRFAVSLTRMLSRCFPRQAW